LKLLSKYPLLKQEIQQQRRIIFGNKRYLFHICIWFIALLYLAFNIFGDSFSEGVQVGMGNGKISPLNKLLVTETPYVIVSFISSLAGAMMVYFYLLLVVPFARYRKQRRFLWLGLITNFVVWTIAFTISAAVMGLTHQGVTKMDQNDTTFIFLLSAVFSGITAGLFFSLYYFLDLYDQQKNLNRYRQVLTQKLEAETNFLKTQINPHFLFNTLNNIYSLTLSGSPDAAPITRQLKALITYMLQECTKDKVALSGEIEFLKNYISLEQLRNKQEQIDISLNIKGDPADKQIAPLLLINFIENAFKHGVKAGIDNAFVKIDLLVMDNTLALDIVNSKPEAHSDQTKAVQQTGGIGIQNVKRRLNILYPHKHRLRIIESKNEFSVYLSIHL
jgi:two-component system LytT family sensor kinase